MPVINSWISPAEGGQLDRSTGDYLTQPIWEALLGDLLYLGGTAGRKGVTNGDTHDHAGGDGALIPNAALAAGIDGAKLTANTVPNAALAAAGAANMKLFVNAAGTGMEAASGIKIGTFTRDTAAATGTQAITGIGFKPSHIIIWAVVPGVAGNMSIGVDNGTAHYAVYDNYMVYTNSWVFAPNLCLVLLQTAAANNTAAVSVLDADGFTLSWAKTGTPTGIAYLFYMAIR